jgi:Holliday junction resolvasome RuvABC endonuclease subunit
MARQACPGATAPQSNPQGEGHGRLSGGHLNYFTPMTTTPPTIIGLDPGTRYLGAAVVRGHELLAYGVHILKNGHQPYDVIGQARRVVFRYIEQYDPQVVAIEAPYLIATERGAVLTVLARELHERSKDLGLEVVELSPEKVRQSVTGNALSTKYEVAQRLAATDFPELRRLVPKKPKTPALWLTSRERYWLHMFDALGLAEAAGRQPDALKSRPIVDQATLGL